MATLTTTNVNVNWVKATSFPQYPWNAPSYGNKRFVAITSDGTNSYSVYTEDGLTGTTAAMPATQSTVTWNFTAFGNGRFVAIGTKPNNTTQFCAYSTDNAATWTAGGNLYNVNTYISLGFASTRFIATAGTGYQWTSYSNDGVTWTAGGNLPTIVEAKGSAYGNGRYMIIPDASNGVSGNVVYTDNEGATWSQGGLLPGGSFPNIRYWRGLSYGRGKFVAICSSGGLPAYSIDGGLTWQDGKIYGDDNSSLNLTSLTYGNGIFLAITFNGSTGMYSYDGINWIKVNQASGGYGSVIYGNGRFVVFNGFNAPYNPAYILDNNLACAFTPTISVIN
jgi:hypothetical protein